MIVMYDAGRLLNTGFRWLGRWVVRTPHLSLVNVLAGRRVVPEFMPQVPDTEVVSRVASQLLHDEQWRELMIGQLADVVAPLRDSSASSRVCDLLEGLTGRAGR
jgi:lipid-A-disaccharide synthase